MDSVGSIENYLDAIINDAPQRTKNYVKTHRTRFIETVKMASPLMFGVCDLAEVGPLSYVGKYLATHNDVRASEILGDLRFPLEHKAESADLVLCLEVLEHINDALLPDSTIEEIAQFSCSGAISLLREIFRILRPGGRLLLTTPNNTSIDSILCLLDKKCSFLYPPHVREYAPRDVISMAENVGFVLVQFKTIFSWWNYSGKQRNPLKATLEAAGYDMTDRGDDAIFYFIKPG